MAVTKSGGPSRAPSARPGSVARDILKKRSKPYKTEQNRILAKRKKMQIQTTYSTAPEGFTFVPLGTPDLSDKCKEVSRQRGLPILVVSAKPVSKIANDPAKVSHHVHRIGYHFRSDVVEDACQELGYMFNRGRFLKEADLADMSERSRMARALARHGIQPHNLPEQEETEDQVRGAIKELFPRIPEHDLKEILRHAWAEGSRRVGTVSELILPRRVQLAVIARIRHAYTDYDYLLKAFDWKYARTHVEQDCLRKLIEWRGENDDEDDGELEEVIRETIVIDDDDDEPEVIFIDDEPETINLDDDDSEPEQRGSGYTSDTSVEISHRVAADEDLGAESHDERSKSFLERYQLRPRNVQQRDLDVRQKIGAARERLRNERLPMVQPEIVRVHVPESSNGIIEIGGKQYRRAPSAMPILPPSPPHAVPPPPAPPYANANAYSQPLPLPTMPTDNLSAYDRPVQSIEPQDELRRVALASAAVYNKTRLRPATPDSEASEKRRRLDDRQRRSPARSWQPPADNLGQVLTRAEYPSHRHYGGSWADIRGPQSPSNGSPIAAYGLPNANVKHVEADFAPSPVPYDPQRPLLQPEDYREHGRGSQAYPRSGQDHRFGFADAQPAPIQYMQHPHQRQAQVPHPPHATSSLHSPQYYSPGYSQPQVIYVQNPPTPLPVHGAPAAVQQVPREPPPAPPGVSGLYQQPAPHMQQPSPYHGSPAQPAQFPLSSLKLSNR